jgi:hypothetical protein
MTSNILGMDPEKVRQLGQMMQHSSDQIKQIAQTLTQQLHDAPWNGNDRHQFESDWQSNHLKALHTVEMALHAASQKAYLNATKQEETSAQY